MNGKEGLAESDALHFLVGGGTPTGFAAALLIPVFAGSGVGGFAAIQFPLLLGGIPVDFVHGDSVVDEGGSIVGMNESDKIKVLHLRLRVVEDHQLQMLRVVDSLMKMQMATRNALMAALPPLLRAAGAEAIDDLMTEQAAEGEQLTAMSLELRRVIALIETRADQSAALFEELFGDDSSNYPS